MNNFWKTFFAALLAVVVGFILHFIFIMLFISALIFGAASSEKGPILKNNSVLKIDLTSTVIAERSSDYMSDISVQNLISGTTKPTLGILDATNAICKAATDPKISAIYIYSGSEGYTGISCLEELRAALEEFHNSGKPILAYGMNFTLGSYYLSSIADKIYMNTEGSAMITGLGGYLMFYKDIIDKLGIDFQLIRHGKFKAAAEQFISNNISNENREQNEALFKAMWNVCAEAICKNRDISYDELNNAVDNLELSDATSMLEKKLIDDIFSVDQMYNKLCTITNSDTEKGYNSISLTEYARTLVPKSSTNKIAVLYANGDITMDGTTGIVAPKFIQNIATIRKDKNIKAVVLRVNSPGGDAQAAEVIREELKLLQKEKPVIVSYGEYAASGGYWISAEGNTIISDQTTITGSIGVFSMALSVGNALKKNLHINPVSIKTHSHATVGNGIEPLDDKEIAYIQKSIEHVYNKFIDIVADGRKMTKERVDSIAQGRIWSGLDAKNVGLVDMHGTLRDAIYLAAVSNDETTTIDNYQIVEYPRPKTQLETFMEIISGESSINVQTKFIDYINQLKGIKTVARLPYVYQINK